MILLFILFILSSPGSIPVASKLIQNYPSPTNENPTQPRQDDKPIVPTMPAAQSRTNPPLPTQSNNTARLNHIHPTIPSRRVTQGATSQPEPAVQLLVTEPAPSPPELLSARTNQAGHHNNNMFSPANHQRDTARPSSSARAHPTTSYTPFLTVPQNFQPPVPSHPVNNPWWYQLSPFLASQGNEIAPNEYLRMDQLSLCVINYFLTGGLSNTASWAQRPSLSTSIHIQCFLNQTAFSLFALAHLVFPRTRPRLAFIIDRLSFLLIVVSGYLSNMPMFPPYVAIIMLLLVSFVYVFSRFRG